MRIAGWLLRASQILRSRGLVFFWRYLVDSIWFDFRHRTRTSGRVPKDAQSISFEGLDRADGVLYVASFTSVVRRTVHVAEEVLGSRNTSAQFVDLGCGKGKALLVYCLATKSSLRPPAVGIEYDERLANIAKTNLSVCGFDSGDAVVITDSAANLSDHLHGGAFIVYMYNPFQGPTFYRVLDTLSGIPHVLIYVDPVELQALVEYQYTIHEQHEGRYNADTWVVASRLLEHARTATKDRP